MQATVCACSMQHAACSVAHATACHAICGIGRAVGSATSTRPADQHRSCADLMSASVFVSLFLLLLLFLCVRLCNTNFSFSWGQVCERSVLISLQQLAAPLAAAAAIVDAFFVAGDSKRALQMKSAFKGAAARGLRESVASGSCRACL